MIRIKKHFHNDMIKLVHNLPKHQNNHQTLLHNKILRHK